MDHSRILTIDPDQFSDMQYLMTFHMRADQMPGAELNDKCFSEMLEFVADLKENNILFFDSQILPEPAAIRVENESSSVHLAETLGGFFILNVESHEQAVELARRCPHNQVGAIGLYALNETDENAYRPDA